MATPQKGEGIGSDEATDVIQDLCAYCVARDRPQPALHFCFECGPYGRYICGSCAQFHNLFTQGHTFLRISDSKKQQSKIANDLKMEKKKNAELQSKLDDKDRDLDQMRDRINMQTELLEKTKRAMSEDLETKKKEKAEMQSKLAVNNRELQQLRDRLKDEYLTKQTISIELATEKKKNAELQSKLADSNRELEQLKVRLKEEKKIRTDLDMTKRTMSSELELGKKTNSELQSKLAEAISEVNQLRDQLKAEHRIQTEVVKAVAAVMISQDRMLVDNPLGCVEDFQFIKSNSVENIISNVE